MKMLGIVVATLLIAGCPPAEKSKKAPAPSAACSAFGQTCEVSAGKLGTCVSKEPCSGGDCLVCQSQH